MQKLVLASMLGATLLAGVAVAAQVAPPPSRMARPATAAEVTQRADRMFARLDANRDGAISRQEFGARALKRFGRVDANRDGRIDAAERTAMREKRRQRRD